jgi:hypothetical protein
VDDYHLLWMIIDYRSIWMIDIVRDRQLPQIICLPTVDDISSMLTDHHPQRLIKILIGWLSSRVNSHHLPFWINIVLFDRKSAAVDEYRSRQMKIVCCS